MIEKTTGINIHYEWLIITANTLKYHYEVDKHPLKL